MNCPVCTNPMIRTRATSYGEEYDYCRTCKKELSELGSPTPKATYEASRFVSDQHRTVTQDYRFRTIVTGDPFTARGVAPSCYNTPDKSTHTVELSSNRCTCGAFDWQGVPRTMLPTGGSGNSTPPPPSGVFLAQWNKMVAEAAKYCPPFETTKIFRRGFGDE